MASRDGGDEMSYGSSRTPLLERRRTNSISRTARNVYPLQRLAVSKRNRVLTCVVAYLVVENGSWFPARMTMKAFGGEDRWEYGNWQPLMPSSSRKLPKAIMHHSPAGGNDIYSVTDARVEEHVEEQLEDGKDGEARLLYSKPTSKLAPRRTWSYPKTHIDNDQPSTVKMVRAESGHYLIRPLIDGQDIGSLRVSSLLDYKRLSVRLDSSKGDEIFRLRRWDVLIRRSVCHRCRRRGEMLLQASKELSDRSTYYSRTNIYGSASRRNL